MTFTVHGLDELAAGLQADFARLQGPETKRALRNALYAGAVMLRDEARRLAPVRAAARSGHPAGLLRKSIQAGSNSGQGAVLAQAGVFVRGKTMAYGQNTANRRKQRVGERYPTEGAAYYWRFLEFGTVNMPPHPFLAPAFDNNVDKIGPVMAERLARAIDEQLAKRT